MASLPGSLRRRTFAALALLGLLNGLLPCGIAARR
jgi:sulfite exporter TauE/SafE